MKIGIVVHSHTGNTHSVGQRLREALERAGHKVEIERLEVVGGEQPNARQFQITSCPDVSGYDAVILGAPVRGATISPVMAAFLSQVPTLKGKKVLCYVTMFFPFAWMGGSNAIAKMGAASEARAGSVCGTGIIRWSGRGRDERITAVIDQFVRALGS